MASVRDEKDAPVSVAKEQRTAARAKDERSEAPAAHGFATLWYGLAGSLLSFSALPPAGLWPLAWVAPLPWLLLIRRPNLPGRYVYSSLWLAGFAFWGATLHWLRLPHPATCLGWFALSFYLAFYLPLFVGLTRVAVHQLGISIILAAPVVWAGFELAQSHALTGINIATPGHSQYQWLTLIQISDLCGGYGVSFVVLFVAACVARMIPVTCGARRTWWPFLPATAMLAAVLSYGAFRTADEHLRPGLKVALVQGSIDTQMKADPTQVEDVHKQYFGLTARAVRDNPGLDLVVWPETMFRRPLISYHGELNVSEEAGYTAKQVEAAVEEQQALFAAIADKVGVPLLIGMDRFVFHGDQLDRYNSAVLIERDGSTREYYDKMRRVMFGEYVPMAHHWPWLYRLTPLSSGIEPGAGPKALTVAGVRIAPNICFETLLPHFIRGQVATLAAEGAEPDVLVNLTNDGWFWGSSELDLHLMCGVFRAVECRKPLLIAANTGFSAVIDGDGRILQQGPRRDTGVLIADVRLDDRHSPYVRYGDWGTGLCLGFAAVLGAVGLRGRFAAWRQRRKGLIR